MYIVNEFWPVKTHLIDCSSGALIQRCAVFAGDAVKVLSHGRDGIMAPNPADACFLSFCDLSLYSHLQHILNQMLITAVNMLVQLV